MATRALVGWIGDNRKLTSTYNHYDGYPENLGVGLSKFYEEPNEARKVASTGYISYMNPESGEIEAKHTEPANVTQLSDDFNEAMYEIASVADSYGADYIYIYDIENLEWVDVKMFGTRSTAERLMDKLVDLDGGLFRSMDEVQLDEDYTTKWKKFLNEESPLYNDMGEVSDTIYDYADRMRGSDVEDVEELVYYYQNNPDEIPEPMNAKFFVQYADEIAQAINDQERYESGDIDTY
jgi:hypothetical protein